MLRCRLLLCCLFVVAQVSLARAEPVAFDGVTRWQRCLTAGDVAALKAEYSTDPPAKSIAQDQKSTADISAEITFWQQTLSSDISDLKVDMVSEQDQQGLHMVSLQISMKASTARGHRTRYVMEQQAWQQQGETWRIVAARHSDLLKMRPALKRNPNLYDKDADARTEITQAMATAAKNHQRVILVFGGNWCYDCHVLDQAFHQDDVLPILDKNFQVVHVDIGDDGKKNGNLASEYNVPIDKGVPALAILDPDGKLLYSQRNGEWESARSLDPDDVIDFLNKWKP